MYLIFNQNLGGYLSITKSMQSALEIMIGKLSATQFLQSNSILGPIIISAYCSVILFFALNIFISIILESFDNVRREAKIDPDKFGFMGHVLEKLRNFIKKSDKSTPSTDYLTPFDLLPKQVDQIIDILIIVF